MSSDQSSAYTSRSMPLEGLRVLDLSTIIAAPLAAMILGDYGAEVIKIEHPSGGDPARSHGYDRDGVPLWWLMLSRNKKSVTLYLGSEDGQRIFRELALTADVIIENFRPGTMERWGLGYSELSRDNPGLIMAHVSGFGRQGPQSSEPGFGTMGEVLSGFAFRNGRPDEPPTLPPFGLADGVTGMATAMGVVTALHERTTSGLGQEVDLAIIEPLLTVLEPQLITHDQIGRTLERTGNQAEMNAPRGLYRTVDDQWVAVSASTVSTASRLMRLVGGDEIVGSDWFGFASGRRRNAEKLDELIVPWFACREANAAVATCREVGVPVAPVYSAGDILQDAQFEAIGSVARVQDARLGEVRMPNVLFRLSETPGQVRWPGPNLGEHTDEILADLGITPKLAEELRARGVIQ